MLNVMLNRIARLGNVTCTMLSNLGRAGIFLTRVIWRVPVKHRLWFMIRLQLYSIGVKSCLIIGVSALFIGMVVGLQGYHTLERFGALSQLGPFLALSIVRELGPVISALLFAGRAGTALTAELGLMKATEQLSSMDMMGVDPLGHMIYPRFIAGFLALPLLTLLFAVIAIYGGYAVGVQWLGLDAGSFWSNMQAAVSFRSDVLGGVIKSLVFAWMVLWIAVDQGFTCVPTADGISHATTQTVVYASLTVLGFDFLLTAMMMGGG